MYYICFLGAAPAARRLDFTFPCVFEADFGTGDVTKRKSAKNTVARRVRFHLSLCVRSRNLGRGCDKAEIIEEQCFSYAKSPPERVPGDKYLSLP